jgi:nucleoside-diphosphate-sugar epimerase
MRVLIVGCGYVGLPLGAELANQGHEVFGLRRSIAGDAELRAVNIIPLHGDITKPDALVNLPTRFDWVVNCAASGGGDADSYRQLYLTGNHNLVEWLKQSPPRKYIWTSSTSVYGQDDGSVVTESNATEPPTETGRILVETENLLLAVARESGFPTVILRLAGIYGPDRGYWFRQFLHGEAKMEGDGSRFLNMIHRDDVVGAIIAALEHAPAESVFNVVDDEPVSQRDFFAWLSAQLDKPMPPSVAVGGEISRKRGVTNKRVSNRRLKGQLGYQFNYPTFREGYARQIREAKTELF